MVVAPNDFIGKKYRGKYCYEHHLVYWKTYGVVPNKDEVIHHKNGNKHDNSPDNLELKTNKIHLSEHTKNRGKLMVELKCPYCGKHFIKEKRQTYLMKNSDYSCCSRKCSGAFAHLSKEEKQVRLSETFIREFREYPII